MTEAMRVTTLHGSRSIDMDSGSLIMWRRFTVQRNDTSEPHTVSVRVSESGTPQEERCDCKGFQVRKTCAHIEAVYSAGVLDVQWD